MRSIKFLLTIQFQFICFDFNRNGFNHEVHWPGCLTLSKVVSPLRLTQFRSSKLRWIGAAVVQGALPVRILVGSKDVKRTMVLLRHAVLNLRNSS